MSRTYKKASDIKVGVIGYGGAFNMGKKHLEEMQKAGMTPACVCEIDEDRLAVAEQDWPGIELYSSVSQMLRKSDVDLLAIITPHNTHAKLAGQCLRDGRHIMCEKPLAITTAECDRMIAAARKAGVVLSTYHNRHWDGCALRAVREIVDKGVIGDVVRIEAHMGAYGQPKDWWRSSKSISGGILYDWGVHQLEYALQLLPGAEIVEVMGFNHHGFWAEKTAWGQDTNEDDASAIVRMSNGAMINLNITHLDCNAKMKDRKWQEITGTKGTYMFDGKGWKTLKPGRGGKIAEKEGNNPKGRQQKYYKNIADHLVSGEPLVITPEWSRRPIHILNLACRSAKAGKAMKAKYK